MKLGIIYIYTLYNWYPDKENYRTNSNFILTYNLYE